MPIVSMSVSEQLIKKFDEAAEKMGYAGRSEAFRDALRLFVDKSEWASSEGENSAIILVLYDEKLISKRDLSDIEHVYHEIHAVLHLHLDNVNCLEVLVADGTSSRIKGIIQHIRKTKGIKQIQFMTAASGI